MKKIIYSKNNGGLIETPIDHMIDLITGILFYF
jgi:hypothetical protein